MTEPASPAASPNRRDCRVCERRGVAINQIGGGLRHHKISPAKHAEVFPGWPYLDGQCPGTGEQEN